MGVGCIPALFLLGRTAWVRPLVAYVFGDNLLPLTSAPGDHDGWEKSWCAAAVVPSQEHVLVIASPVELTLAGIGVLSSVSEDSLPVLRADFGERGRVASHR